jgi:putative ABC transport system substrate-binding protein
MKRREFITLLGGAAAWPIAARAQTDRMRRIGLLMVNAEGDPEGQTRVGAFRERLRELGWTEGRNVRIDYRWGVGDPARASAADLVTLAPDAILANGTPAVVALHRVTRSIPVVFVVVVDCRTSAFACR